MEVCWINAVAAGIRSPPWLTAPDMQDVKWWSEGSLGKNWNSWQLFNGQSVIRWSYAFSVAARPSLDLSLLHAVNTREQFYTAAEIRHVHSGAPCPVQTGSARALNDEARWSTQVPNLQADPARRDSRTARDGVEYEQHPVRLEGLYAPTRSSPQNVR